MTTHLSATLLEGLRSDLSIYEGFLVKRDPYYYKNLSSEEYRSRVQEDIDMTKRRIASVERIEGLDSAMQQKLGQDYLCETDYNGFVTCKSLRDYDIVKKIKVERDGNNYKVYVDIARDIDSQINTNRDGYTPSERCETDQVVVTHKFVTQNDIVTKAKQLSHDVSSKGRIASVSIYGNDPFCSDSPSE